MTEDDIAQLVMWAVVIVGTFFCAFSVLGMSIFGG